MKIVSVLLFLLMHSLSYGQKNERTYFFLNKLIEEYGADSIPFLLRPNLKSPRIIGSDPYEEAIENFQNVTQKNLRGDSLHQFRRKFTKSKIKRMFVSWNADKINLKQTVKQTDQPFFYISKPVLIKENMLLFFRVIHEQKEYWDKAEAILCVYDEQTDKFETLRRRLVWKRGSLFR